MRLHDTIFGEVATGLGAVPENEGLPRRRGAPRFHVDREVTIKPHGSANAVARPVTLLNISASGVGIMDRLPVSAGYQFIISLPRPAGGTIDIVCTVRQSRLTNTGAFRVGAEFTSEMERDARFVRGVEGVVDSGKSPQAPAGDTDLHQPARIRMLAGSEAANSIPAQLQSFAGGVLVLLTTKSVVAGEQFILEVGFSGENVQAWKCTVIHAGLVDGQTFRVSARRTGAADVHEAGHRSWLKRLFAS